MLLEIFVQLFLFSFPFSSICCCSGCPYFISDVIVMYPPDLCIDVFSQSSTLVSPLYFLDIYSLSISTLICKALYIVINFLILSSICLCSTLVHCKNGPEYMTRVLPCYLSIKCDFFLQSLLSRSFLHVQTYYFLIFSFSADFLIFLNICYFYFLEAFWFVFQSVMDRSGFF